MINSILDVFKRVVNRVVDIVIYGNLDRLKIINEFNRVFNNSYLRGELNRKCRVTTSPGKAEFRHELSSFNIRSGFKITILNDDGLTESDLFEISGYVLESQAFVRQMMAVGYDTLVVKGESSTRGLQIPLKKFANLDGYMLR